MRLQVVRAFAGQYLCPIPILSFEETPVRSDTSPRDLLSIHRHSSFLLSLSTCTCTVSSRTSRNSPLLLAPAWIFVESSDSELRICGKGEGSRGTIRLRLHEDVTASSSVTQTNACSTSKVQYCTLSTRDGISINKWPQISSTCLCFLHNTPNNASDSCSVPTVRIHTSQEPPSRIQTDDPDHPF